MAVLFGPTTREGEKRDEDDIGDDAGENTLTRQDGSEYRKKRSLLV